MPRALARPRPSISRNELGWLATLDAVNSRLIFVEHENNQKHYRAETAPFDPEYLADLPKGNWSLLVPGCSSMATAPKYRNLHRMPVQASSQSELLLWMLKSSAFEIPEKF